MARTLANCLKNVLPKDFAAKQAEFHQMETFLNHFFNKEVAKHIQLMSCMSQRVVLAAKTPQVAGYLKLQKEQLENQMLLQLDAHYRVLIKTNPKAIEKRELPKKLPKATGSKVAAKAVNDAAEMTEDDALKKSLERLANTLKTI
ncbi:MAG: hypothetical protein ISR69_10895 [Gammaproteobacteria bacterium]|nr:hypothetical protein [Gammaproteobacteria bacterium]